MRHFSEISPSAERVVDAAEELIQQRGYNGFSYDDVAKRVGIKKPSIHHHFSTKSELVAVVVQRYMHRFREHLLRIEGQSTHAAGRLNAYAELFEITFLKERRFCLCGMLGAESESLPSPVMSEIRRFFEVNIDWLTMVISDGQHKGCIDAIKAGARPLAEAYLYALEGAMVVGRGMQSGRPGPADAGKTLLSLMCTRIE